MNPTLFLVRETLDFEKRVALVPDDVKKLIQKGYPALVEQGAGLAASFPDEAYEAVGAKIVTAQEGYLQANIILTVQGPSVLHLNDIQTNSTIIAMLQAFSHQSDLIKKASLFALERLPRITRAQSMDVLSSQSNLAGYKAVILAALHYQGIFPLMMTAAGTLAPAKVLVLGAGVAGLQAIATAKRLGAQVAAFDVRASAKEEVESLAARFVSVAHTEKLETADGYAKETGEDYQKRQRAALSEELKQANIVITTALIPGKAAPLLIPKNLVELMKPGSVIVDLAVAQGGNCEASRFGEIVDYQGVLVIGEPNLPSLVAKDASRSFSKNIFNFLEHYFKHQDQLESDPILAPCRLS